MLRFGFDLWPRKSAWKRIFSERSWGGNCLETLNLAGWSLKPGAPGSENGALKIAIEWRIDLGYSWMSWIVHFQINPPLFKLRPSSSNLIICRSSFRSSFGEDRVGLGLHLSIQRLWRFHQFGIAKFRFSWCLLLGAAVGIIFCGYNYDNNSYTLGNMQDVSSMMFPREFPGLHLFYLFGVCCTTSWTKPHIIPYPFPFIDRGLKLQWPHHDVMTLVAKGNHPNFSFISGWWITIYQPNGDDSSHCSSIGLLYSFFWETTFSVWMNIFGWWFTLHESFENGSKWTIPPKNWTVSDPKETSRVQNSAPNQRSPKPYEPRSKLPAIDFSIRWNLFLKKLNGVTRTQAFHKLRASSCTCKLRASPKSRR